MLEMPLRTPAMPTVSSSRFHGLPLNESPASTVRSMSVLSHGSTLPSGPAGASEQAHGIGHLLLQIEANARSALIGAHRSEGIAHVQTCRLREIEGILKAPHPPADEKTGDLDLARLAPQRVSILDFSNHLELIEGGVETVA